MSKDFLSDRRRALEDSFFSEKDKELLRQLQVKMKSENRRQELAKVTGIEDQNVLDRLDALELDGETWIALSMVPLVVVAWADGSIASKERQALLDACDRQGLRAGTPAHDIFQRWLEEEPSPAVLEAWKAYTAALCRSMDAEAKQTLKSECLGRARAVAEAAGGILGLGNKVSDTEQAKLQELESAFE